MISVNISLYDTSQTNNMRQLSNDSNKIKATKRVIVHQIENKNFE